MLPPRVNSGSLVKLMAGAGSHSTLMTNSSVIMQRKQKLNKTLKEEFIKRKMMLKLFV